MRRRTPLPFLLVAIALGAVLGCAGFYQQQADLKRAQADQLEAQGDTDAASAKRDEAAALDVKAAETAVKEDAAVASLTAATPFIPPPWNLLIPAIGGALVASTRRRTSQ